MNCVNHPCCQPLWLYIMLLTQADDQLVICLLFIKSVSVHFGFSGIYIVIVTAE